MKTTEVSSERAQETTTERIAGYLSEFNRWKENLKRYWPQIDKNQEMYEFYKSEGTETASDVSLNTPFAIIESQVAKFNDSTINVTVDAEGTNGMDDFEEYVSSILKRAIEDPDIARVNGSFRKQKEMFTRDFLVKGNAVAEACYMYKTQIVNGEKKVIADNPYIEVRNFKSYVFNPAFTFDNAPVKYLEKFVSYDWLRNQEYKETEEKDELGKKVTNKSGIYKNLSELKSQMPKNKETDHEDQKNVSGDSRIPKKVEPIRLLERWDGPKLCVIAMGGVNAKGVIIREEYDPKKIGHSGILTAMNYKIEGRPYAYGDIDAIYKPVRAQDTVMNQSIELVNRALRPGVLVSDPDADLDAIMEVMEAGGVTFGNAQGITSIPTNFPPQASFQTIDTLQQSIERAARYSPYAAGTPSQQTDKTAGTASGIQRLQTAAEPNFQVKLDTIQDSFMQPLGDIYLRMIGNLMDQDEVRYGMLKRKGQKWVTATKGVLTGKASIDDLITVEMIKPEEATELLAELGIQVDPMDPMGAMQAIVFDVDWVVDVKLDNQAKADKVQETQEEMMVIETGMKLGVQFSPERVTTRMARKQGIEDIEDLYLTEEEQAQQAQAQQAQMQQEQQMQQQQMQAEMQMKQQEQQMKMAQSQEQHGMKQQMTAEQHAQKLKMQEEQVLAKLRQQQAMAGAR